jgi:serine/threonine protein phosphatase 1
MLTFAVGDIHGCYEKLVSILAKCESYAESGRYRLVFLGDYIDRGKDSRAVLELLIELQASRADVVCLAGNHEDLLVRSLEDPLANAEWLNHGGIETLDSYSSTGGMWLLHQHTNWIHSLPQQFDDGLRYFVHAGVDVSKRLCEQSKEDLLWMREPFLSFEGQLERLIVHGHTPAKDGPEMRPHRINLDTGAVYGGSLTAAIFDEEQALPLGFLSA